MNHLMSPLPVGWQLVKLGDVCDFIDSMRVPVNETERLKRIAGKNKDELYPYYGANGQVGWIDNYLFNEELVLVAEDGGFFGSYDRPIAYRVSGKCWVNNHAHVLRPKNHNVHVDWLYYSLAIRPDIMEYVSGTTRLKLNQEQAAQISIFLPPFSEQERISTRLRSFMQEVDSARAACEKQMEAAKALPAAYLREVFESEEAKKWERRRIGELFNVQQGVAMSPDRRQGISPHPFLRTLNVLWGKVDLTSLDNMDFTENEVVRLNLKRGDLLVCEGGEVGRTAIWKGELETCLYQNHVHRLRPQRDDIFPEFSMFWMEAAFKVFQSYAGQESTTTIPNLSGRRLKSFVVPVPPKEIQRQISLKLSKSKDASVSLINSLERELETINALPQAILRKAFFGEL